MESYSDPGSSRPSDGEKRSAPKSIIVPLALTVGIGVLGGLYASNFFMSGARRQVAPTTAQTTAQTSLISKRSPRQIREWIQAELNRTGAKFAVVNVWATWCAPCREEMPELVRFQKSQAAHPLFLVSADNTSDVALAETFLKEMAVEFDTSIVTGDQQIFVDEWQKLSSIDPAKQWSMTLPATFFIDASGRVKNFIVGGTNQKEIEARLKLLVDAARY